MPEPTELPCEARLLEKIAGRKGSQTRGHLQKQRRHHLAHTVKPFRPLGEALGVTFRKACNRFASTPHIIVEGFDGAASGKRMANHVDRFDLEAEATEPKIVNHEDLTTYAERHGGWVRLRRGGGPRGAAAGPTN